MLYLVALSILLLVKGERFDFAEFDLAGSINGSDILRTADSDEPKRKARLSFNDYNDRGISCTALIHYCKKYNQNKSTFFPSGGSVYFDHTKKVTNVTRKEKDKHCCPELKHTYDWIGKVGGVMKKVTGYKAADVDEFPMASTEEGDKSDVGLFCIPQFMNNRGTGILKGIGSGEKVRIYIKDIPVGWWAQCLLIGYEPEKMEDNTAKYGTVQSNRKDKCKELRDEDEKKKGKRTEKTLKDDEVKDFEKEKRKKSIKISQASEEAIKDDCFNAT